MRNTSTARRFSFRPAPPQAISLSFAAMILVGAVLLNLPIASQSGESVGFINALFTATSANCVTGLVVVNTLEHWTLFGKLVILVLIQLGGLGLMTLMTLAMVFLRRRISLENRLIIQASFNQDNVGGMVRLVRKVIGVTLCFEGVGAILLAAGFYFSAPRMSFVEALGKGVFHAVSAFCNAGFDLIGPNSLIPYQDNFYICLIIMALIVAGGLGFMVWGELLTRPKRRGQRGLYRKWIFLSLHSKLALTVTAALLLLGLGLFLLFEWSNPATLGPLGVPQKMLAAMFQSVTLRTSGFDTIGQGGLTAPSQLLSCVFMFIGGSPAGTAGGIKTVTIGIILVAMHSLFRGRQRLEVFGRTLPLDLLQKALTVVSAMLIIVVGATFLLFYTEQNSVFPHSMLDLLFESASATGTVGLTTGITPYLSSAGKVVLTICMFLGRLGPVTAVVSLNMRLRKGVADIEYPSERVIIG